MNYLRLDSRKRKSNYADIARAVVLVLALIVVFYIFSQPITHALRWVQSTLVQTFFASQPTIRATDDAVLIDSLQTESLQLKELLGKKVTSEPMILASVIIRPPRSPYDSIVIEGGENEGVHPGMIAYAELQYAIGRVTEVKERTSIVTLFSSSNQREDVLIGMSASSSLAIAEGRGGGNFYIKIPRNIEVHVGDPIVWPAANLVLLGTIEKIDADMGGTYSHIYFKSPINIQSLRYVQLKEQL